MDGKIHGRILTICIDRNQWMRKKEKEIHVGFHFIKIKILTVKACIKPRAEV